MSSYFYIQADSNPTNGAYIENLREYAEENKILIYVLNQPLTDQKYFYSYDQSLIILSPKKKVAIVDFGADEDAFGNYVDDVIEDIGSIADKYLYKQVIGRPRQWRFTLVDSQLNIKDLSDIDSFFESLTLTSEIEIKNLDLLISLFIGSINDIERVKETIPETDLDKIKQKIQLFDGDQTRFIYQNPKKKRIDIQGLSGTGKTELLLHKLKDLYITDSGSSICFTCHNRILADSLRKRIPSFFNFMKVEQQIEWDKRLWCTNAWGSGGDENSGAYRYICAFYEISFFPWSRQMTFTKACSLAISDIRQKYPKQDHPRAFTYMFIDESQDFDEEFFTLCNLVTEKNTYIAGDIFQNIFDEKISSSIDPDFLLGKCYRTDPKTLMFAHALGMGLFEKTKLRWLEAKEWRDCGYNVTIHDRKYHLTREPLRRFEDLNDDFESIEIINSNASFEQTIIRIIKQIIRENSTVLPHDIGIILIDQDKEIYKLADILEVAIEQTFNWKVNKAYETKQGKENAVLISNRNNVKGLEFPFVICVTKVIRKNLSYRNSLYTMLTRSFIKSFLVIPATNSSGLTPEMAAGLKEIIENQEMVIDEPSETEKRRIRTRFEYQLQRQSHYDLMMAIFKSLRVDRKYHDKLFEATKQFEMLESDEETLTDFVKTNLKYIKTK